jgi:hypothetical protein
MAHSWKIDVIVGQDKGLTLEEIRAYTRSIHAFWLDEPGYMDRLVPGDNLRPATIKADKKDKGEGSDK